MKLPLNIEIAKEKITGYLLKERDDNDKSKYLSLAGYSQENFEQLISDLRTQILILDATVIDSTQYGEKYEIRGVLKSPTEMEIDIITIWMKEYKTERWKFVTLFPTRRRL